MESANKINTMAASAVSEDEFKKVANKVSFITIVQNVLLSVFKLFAGIFAHSNAMISDAVHSASDVFSTIIVIIGVKLASKESDKEHPYGHERLECVAAIVLSIVLLYTGIKIGSQAVKKHQIHFLARRRKALGLLSACPHQKVWHQTAQAAAITGSYHEEPAREAEDDGSLLDDLGDE